MTKKQLTIGAAAVCSLVAGVSAVRLIWPADDEKPPERTAQLSLLAEPAKAPATPDKGPLKPTIEVVKQPEPTIPSPGVYVPPKPDWGSPIAVPPAPAAGGGLPPPADISVPAAPSAPATGATLPPLPGAGPAAPKDDRIPPPPASLVPGAAPVVPAGGTGMPPGGGTGTGTGTGGVPLPALPTPPASGGSLPMVPVPAAPDAGGPKSPSIPAPADLGFGGPKTPAEPKVEPKSPPAPVSGLPVPPAGGLGSPPPGPGAGGIAVPPPPASLVGGIPPVPPTDLSPAAPGGGAGTKIEFVKPPDTPAVTPIAGTVTERTPTTSYDVDIYHPKAGDTYESISREFFNDAKYAAALRAYNRNKALTGGGSVDVPPIHVLRRVSAPQPLPPAGVEVGTPVGRTGTAADPWGPAAGGATTGNGNTYRVPRGGTTLTAVAKSVLGSEQRWRELYNLNAHVSDPNNVPEGTELKLPPDARVRE